jgi:hypothetical protein
VPGVAPAGGLVGGWCGYFAFHQCSDRCFLIRFRATFPVCQRCCIDGDAARLLQEARAAAVQAAIGVGAGWFCVSRDMSS